MSTRICFSLSALLHGSALAALACLDYSRPAAPALAGGRGSGGIEIEVGIWPTDEVGRESRAENAPEEPEETGTIQDDLPGAEEPLFPEDREAPAATLPEGAAEDEPKEAEESAAPIEPPVEQPSRQERAGGTLAGASAGPGIDAPSAGDPGALRPVYPLECRRLGHQGTVVLKVVIGTDGKALAVEVAQSGGCPELDRAAEEAVRRARFHPARQWGKPVPCAIEQVFHFELRG
jgi:protein TonB